MFKFTPPTLAGLFFCLASAEGAGLLFCPAAIQPHTSVYSAFCRVNAIYTAHAAKQRAELYKRFSCDLPHSTAYNTRPTQAAIIPPAQRWSVYTRPDALHRYQIPPPRRTLCRSVQLPYYNNVYKGARVRPCYRSMPDSAAYRRPCQRQRVSASGLHPVQGSARRLAILHRSAVRAHHPPDVAVQQHGRGGRAEPLTATAVSLFGLSPDS